MEKVRVRDVVRITTASIFIQVFKHFLHHSKVIHLSELMMLDISEPEPAEVVTQARARSATKLRAIEDAMEMRSAVAKECAESSIAPPPFTLLELIGKGSFGRVYKAASQTTGSLVAVKIINIEQGDRAAPGASDTFAEILKEVNTVKLLSASGAKNINVIIDALLIGQSMWIVTEYCGGGSVSTLMRPTGFLVETCIIPILREVAEAIFWVHKQGIIHRDIKCANVLVAEDGGVQLCDFGVAGMVKSRFDKRRTVTGTLQWMAPELFDTEVSYGNEVDVWAFGSMAYEAATGLPPNASMSAIVDMDLEQFGEHLRDSCPRLEGDRYSSRLKDLIAYCMVQDPTKRPRIENVQRHNYILDTEQSRPTRGLSKLVAAYKKWEAEGGDRKSLFSPGGAQALKPEESYSTVDEEWDYGTVDNAFDKPPAMVEANMSLQEHPKPRRRHGKPLHVRVSKPPLEKAFDPNTMSNYYTNARRFYGAPSLPPCDNTGTDHKADTLRDSPVRHDSGPVSANSDTCRRMNSDAETFRPGPSRNSSDETTVPFNTGKTQDWTFPVMTPDNTSPTNSEAGFAPPSSVATSPAPILSTGVRSRAGKLHSRRTSSLSNRLSVISLIDLDASLGMGSPTTAQPEIPPTITEAGTRLCLDASLAIPSSSSVNIISPSSPDATTLNADPTNVTCTVPEPPFISLTSSSPTTELFPPLVDDDTNSFSPSSCGAASEPQTHNREPSLYIPTLGILMDQHHRTHASNDSNNARHGTQLLNLDSPTIPRIVFSGSNHDMTRNQSEEGNKEEEEGSEESKRRRTEEPALPASPDEQVIMGYGGRDGLREELERLIGGMWEHLEWAEGVVSDMAVVGNRDNGEEE
ncbi:kinase-like domain-containing protein [Cladorrhinum sp. PSN259]|nr:kinase-like domain-containing protein [Cladorrhinum sp. PSN259]